ncbi:bifunctional riboflavin kinase/FAD synthetase [Ornithinibacillus scapharcae]|uniref:bifunctional riboflavin kinase/FAD synthetase n=1 Tax=Ornithinibacillus scapharcae TaxID=1147159 RepID=UPI000225B533|nr:bifunctional riboflavin kinase/FAD synthetase [Ornithinibacillus scapharcae]
MKIIKLTYPHSLTMEELPKTVTALGFFDGIHKGHQTVIRQAVSKAKQLHMESAVITFYPHPSVVLKDNHDVKYITPLREKQEIMESLGVDRLYIISFTKELSSLSPQEFINHFIMGLNIHHVVAGFDFTYGHKGKGNMETISEHSKGLFGYTTIDKVTLGNEKISSTRIRNLLALGDMELVKTLLERPYITRGIVIQGDSRGKEIGYPTANIQYNDEALLPKPGIYAVKVRIDDELFVGMASLGTNPTFTEDRKDLSLEVNILDYQGNLYGKELVVEWYKYIRDEEKFNSVEELVQQIVEDEKAIRNYFAVKSE